MSAPTAKAVQQVGRLADKLGWRLETLGLAPPRSANWVSREPGRTLAEVKAVLEAM